VCGVEVAGFRGARLRIEDSGLLCLGSGGPGFQFLDFKVFRSSDWGTAIRLKGLLEPVSRVIKKKRGMETIM
jgi:hypothetical protein